MLLPENIKFLIVHCSDTPNNEDIGAKEIHEMHLRFGWEGIGYHKIIQRDGTIESGRPEFWIGAHTYGLNQKSLGVCLIGSDIFTFNQFSSLRIILDKWKYSYPSAEITGHREVIKTSKTCPNFDVKKWYYKDVP